LENVLVKSGDAVPWDTVIGITGNTGKWATPENPDPDPYKFHAHEEIYTKGSVSPYLDLLTKTRNATAVISYDKKYYYDKFIFADKGKYKKRAKNANDYSR
jgi:murein DD-endopeptidase MepM/ murein hydrolase activator NlpD